MTRGNRRLLWAAVGLAVAALLLVLALRSCRPAPRPSPGGPLLRPRAVSELVVGFWNIRDFSTASRSRDELRQIARIAHKIDCLAIGELNDTQVLKPLTEELATLGGAWEGVQTPSKTGNSPGSSEYYGFVFRSDKLRIRAPPRILPEVAVVVPGEAAAHRFDRDPGTCSFATHDGRLDFTLLVVHITWGAKVALRRAEVRALKDYFLRVRDEDPGDRDAILLGDFNRDAGDESFGELLSIPSMIDTTEPFPPTVVRGTSTYDHILFQRRFVTEYAGVHGVERFDETSFGDDDTRARTAVSDHRPVWIVLNVPERDDD
jgi:endonuclease/exonuclease/phosphatase family metal-dependent hydrolase